jgi:bacteriocin-like protein
MKQNDENKDTKVLSMEELENVAGGGGKTPPPFKEK